MAKLPDLFDPKAVAAEAAWREGRYVEATRLIAEHLDSGAPLSQDFRKLAAKALRSAIRPGLRVKQDPPKWFDIGSDFETLRESGMSKIEAYQTVSDRYTKKYRKGFSVRNIRAAVAYYQKAREAHDDALFAELKARNGLW